MSDNLSRSNQSTEHELSWAGRGLKGNNAEDVKELCDEIERFDRLVALRLEGNTINEAAATAIGQALEKHNEIQRLIWNDLFTTRLKTEVPPSLVKLTQGLMTNGSHIVEINLSDNAFGPIGVEGLQTFLTSSACYTLEELRLNNCGMGIGGGKLLAKALIDCHRNSGGTFALKQFVAGRNRLENEGSQALAEAFQIIGTLEVIRMPQNGIRPPGIEALTNAFLDNPNLRIIDLNDNTITLAAPQLASAISKLPKLEIINLESSLIRTKGALAIARAIGSHKDLKELYLACNEIDAEGGKEIAYTVKNMPNLKLLDLNGNCFGEDGIDEIRKILENQSFVSEMVFSDDEGSDQEGKEEYGEEEDNDEDYEDYEEEDEEEEDTESPSFFYGNNPIQQKAWNNFQINANKSPSMQQQSGADLSSIMSSLKVCSPFSFDPKSTIDTNENKWTTLNNLEKMKEYLQSDEQSVDRAVKLFEEIWTDETISQHDSSLIAGNALKALNFNSNNERNFTQRLSVSLGFVKDEQTGRQRRMLNQRDRIYRTLLDIRQHLPRSTKTFLSIFLQNTPNDQNRCSPEIKQQIISSFQE